MIKDEIERASIRIGGRIWHARHAASAALAYGALATFGAVMDVVDLVHPESRPSSQPARPTHRWLGILVMALLVAGLVFAGQSAMGFVGAVVPHRAERS